MIGRTPETEWGEAVGEHSESYALSRSTSHLLHRAQQVAADRFAARARKSQISLRQFLVLVAIGEQPGASQSELVKMTSVDRSTLADMLKRLASLGLVEKTASEDDKRANTVILTDAGQAAIESAADDARKADDAILDILPKTKAKTFKATLQRIAKAIDEAIEKAEKAERKRRKAEAKKAKRTAEKAAKAAAKADKQPSVS
ncbi:MAG: MarR family transcriptional regulator [Caulobacterales bacterium]